MIALATASDDGFRAMQDQYCERHCDYFEDTEENKLEYTKIFEGFTRMVESYIVESLTAQIAGFSMESFTEMLLAREGQVHLPWGTVRAHRAMTSS
eukprot:SAG11_NODE_1435_length_4914_cov_10.282866_4_plen_96_part_00